MSEWGKIIFLALGLSFILTFPFKTLFKSVFMGGGLLLGVLFVYSYVGNGPVRQAYQQEIRAAEQAKSLLKSFKNTDAVIEALKQKLNHDRNNAKGWYLLGRVYMTQKKWHDAANSFKKAEKLAPKNTDYAVGYVMSLCEGDPGKMSEQHRNTLKKMLRGDPNQGDILMFLGMDAHLRHDVTLAKVYWERLLKLLPRDSEQATMIHQTLLDYH